MTIYHIKSIISNNNFMYYCFQLKKRNLYDCDNQPKTPEEAVLYTRKRNFNIFKKTIPLYDKEGIKIIGRFEIN